MQGTDRRTVRTPGENDTAPLRVLVVNHDAACARLIRHSLTTNGTGVETVVRGSLGDAVGCFDEPLDVVLLDLALPDHPGLEALGVLWAHAPEVPVIVLAAPGEEATALRAVHQGAADYLLTDQIGATLVGRVVRHAAERHRVELRRRRAEEARDASERRYRSLFQESQDAIFITGREGEILELNPAALELFGYEADELTGRSVLTLYADPEDGSRFQQEMEGRGAVREREVRLRHRDGSVLWCLVTSSVRHSPTGEVLGHQGIIHDISARKRAEARLAHDAVHDTLTGLPNRSLLVDRIAQAQARRARNPSLIHAVLFLDLDRFKVVNDSLGHGAGDELLVCVGREIRACLREEDTVARLGGDEFAILLEEIEGIGDATHVAERILSRLERPIPLERTRIVASASIGITVSTGPVGTPEDLLRDADTAMYRAKALGRGRYQVFDRKMHREARRLLRVETELRRAIFADELRLHYQPIIGLRNGEVQGFESLVRWAHPTRGLLAPEEFIPVAEDTGLIVPLGMWVLREACRQAAGWLSRNGSSALTVSVNLSAKQFLQPDLVERVAAILDETGLEGRGLGLELTETALMRNPARGAEMLRRLRDLGIRLYVDDFGTGYSSLSHLQRFPVDVLKIDRSFIRALTKRDEDRRLVGTIVALARGLGLEAVAEGVETEEELSRLRSIGSDAVQGFLFSRPLPALEAERFLAASGA